MEALLTAIVVWISANFDLPATFAHPQVTKVPAMEVTYMRYRAFTAARRKEVSALLDSSGPPEQRREVVAVYNDDTKTIFLPETWSGTSPGDLSVLVHEMVHHLQGEARLKYACPAERETLAYAVQEKWLGLFGKSLASEFAIDPLTLKLSTACMF
jgi:hypothetical protein